MKTNRIHPLRQLKMYKEAMWDLSKKLSEEDKIKNNNTPTTPKDEEPLLSHMTSTIRNLTRHSPGDPPPSGPPWTTSTP